MEITLDKKESNEALIKVKLEEPDYQTKVDQKVKEYSKKAQLKGFRPGKVPTSLIRKMYGKSILVEEINHVLSHALSDYLQENKIKIIGEPLPDREQAQQIDWETQTEFEFNYAIGILEDFKVDISDKVKITKYLIKVDKKTMEDTMEQVKKQYGKVEHPEQADDGDDIQVSIQQADGEQAFEDVTFDSDKFSKKEGSKFLGAKAGEEVKVELKKLFKETSDLAESLRISEEEAKKLKGDYVATIKEIHRVEPAELNQELFDKVFGKDQVDSLESFKKKVEDTIAENYNRESETLLQRDIKDHLVEKTKITIPDEFVKRWLKENERSQLSEEDIEKNYDAYLQELKWNFISGKISEMKDVQVDQNEVVEQTKNMIRGQLGGALGPEMEANMDAFAANYLQSEDGANYQRMHDQLFGTKILDAIKESITINEKSVDLDTFKKKANS